MKSLRLLLGLFIWLGMMFATIFLFGGDRAYAATIQVSESCSLNDAITSVNTGADENTCTSLGTYGNDDTIDIPQGITLLTAHLPEIQKPVSIQGAGMGQTFIDGNSSQYTMFATNAPYVQIKDLTITSYYYFAIKTVDTDIVLQNIEIDGGGVANDTTNIVDIFNYGTGTYNVEVDNLYMHDMEVANFGTAFSVINGGSGETIANIDKVTITDLHASGEGNTLSAFNLVANPEGILDAIITNTTIHDITGDDLVSPFGVFALTEGGSSSISAKIQNVTVTGLRGRTGTGMFSGIKSAALYSAAGGFSDGGQANSSIEVKNSLFADNLNDGVSSNCEVTDFTSVLGGTGTDTNALIVSGGHNISDDHTCSAFTEQGDQQNTDTILPTLGTLQDNGGSIPTRALLSGSPAIGAGEAIPSISTDARGVARSVNKWDVGAFQTELEEDINDNADSDGVPDSVEDAAPNGGDGNNDGVPDSAQAHVTSLPIPSGPKAGIYITLVTPADTTITAAAIQQATELATTDTVFDYPLGLVSFTVEDLTPGSTIPIELYFHTNLNPNSLIARKYNPNTTAYTTLSTQTDTNLSQVTIANQPVLKLTYSLTDGGSLDLDNEVNGTIQDPVGLATQVTGAPDTGLSRHWLLKLR